MACVEKFTWIGQLHKNSPGGLELKALDYAELSDSNNMDIKDLISIKDNEDKLRIELAKRNDSPFVINIYKQTLLEDYPSTGYTWRELFMKLCFEQMLEYFPQHQDFKLFYKYINEIGPFISCLRVKILDKSLFKSNHYWLMSLIGHMKGLKNIKFHKDTLTTMGSDGFKFMSKGFKYF